MSTIIHLVPPHKAAPPVAAGEPLPACQIIIFPGVRIEREAPPFAAEASETRSDGDTANGSRPRKSS